MTFKEKVICQVVREGFYYQCYLHRNNTALPPLSLPLPLNVYKCTHTHTQASIQSPSKHTHIHTTHSHTHTHLCNQEYLSTSEIRHILSRSYTTSKGNANQIKKQYSSRALTYCGQTASQVFCVYMCVCVLCSDMLCMMRLKRDYGMFHTE